MANYNYTGVVKIKEEFRDGSWLITSDNLPGLFLAGEDLHILHTDIPAAIKLLYELNYSMNVKVCAAGNPKDMPATPIIVDPEIERLKSENEKLTNILASLRDFENWDDKDLPEEDLIKAAHPLKTKKHYLYAEALRLVHAKHSKYALVDLINWLLFDMEQLKARVAELEAMKVYGAFL